MNNTVFTREGVMDLARFAGLSRFELSGQQVMGGTVVGESDDALVVDYLLEDRNTWIRMAYHLGTPLCDVTTPSIPYPLG